MCNFSASISLCFLFSFRPRTRKKSIMSKKVEDKRDEKIEVAAKHGDWDTVLKLLDQPLLNAERNDRRHGILSTNWIIDKTGGSSIELENVLPDYTLNPLEVLLQKKSKLNNSIHFKQFKLSMTLSSSYC